MNKEKFDALIEKYKQGESSLAEEQMIVDNAGTLSNESQAWFKFIRLNKKKAPEGLQESIWESLHKKKIIYYRIKIGVLGAAASLLLLLSIMVYKPFGNVQSYKNKQALLNEALQMFENNNITQELKPVYEDDMIIIYASAEYSK